MVPTFSRKRESMSHYCKLCQRCTIYLAIANYPLWDSFFFPPLDLLCLKYQQNLRLLVLWYSVWWRHENTKPHIPWLLPCRTFSIDQALKPPNFEFTRWTFPQQRSFSPTERTAGSTALTVPHPNTYLPEDPLVRDPSNFRVTLGFRSQGSERLTTPGTSEFRVTLAWFCGLA